MGTNGEESPIANILIFVVGEYLKGFDGLRNLRKCSERIGGGAAHIFVWMSHEGKGKWNGSFEAEMTEGEEDGYQDEYFSLFCKHLRQESKRFLNIDRLSGSMGRNDLSCMKLAKYIGGARPFEPVARGAP